MLHWRLHSVYYTNLAAQSIPFSMVALCDDNGDVDDDADNDDDNVFISSHSSTLDPPAASYIKNSTPHNANIGIFVICGLPPLCLHRNKTRVWRQRMSEGDGVRDMSTTTVPSCVYYGAS